MNTVEALKNLYKTMTGNDWPYDPNPTDAEVIDKIAADGSAGGSGGSGLTLLNRVRVTYGFPGNSTTIQAGEKKSIMAGGYIYSEEDGYSEPWEEPFQCDQAVIEGIDIPDSAKDLVLCGYSMPTSDPPRLILYNAGSEAVTFDASYMDVQIARYGKTE